MIRYCSALTFLLLTGCGAASTVAQSDAEGATAVGSDAGDGSDSNAQGDEPDASADVLVQPSDVIAPDGSVLDQSKGPRVPLQHRATASACASERPAGNVSPLDVTDAGAQCRQDSDCKDGINGRCMIQGRLRDAGIDLVCTYDECVSDDDCSGNRACGCRGSSPNFPTLFNENRCIAGDCRVDADCADGQSCSPSPGCAGGGYQTLHCHTSMDKCVDDADCAGDGFCFYYEADRRWDCVNQRCADGGAP
jgi:hypothetical protein